MSLAVLKSRALAGMNAPEVTVEVHLANGLPSFTIVGLPETEVKESKDRVGDIIDTPIGTLFFRGAPLKESADRFFKTTTSKLNLDLSPGNVRILDRWAPLSVTGDEDEEPRLLLPRAPASPTDDLDYHGALVYIGDDSNRIGCLVQVPGHGDKMHAVADRRQQGRCGIFSKLASEGPEK